VRGGWEVRMQVNLGSEGTSERRLGVRTQVRGGWEVRMQ
jgi:hypothetical protein